VAEYRILIKPSAVREIDALAKKGRQRIARKIQSLSGEPRPRGCEKLSGEDKYRIRQGDNRIVYLISDQDLTLIVVKVGHWREVYRRG
jgi:mRNA interferase RelE/StbE